MTVYTILLIAFGLAMDAFAVSVSNGIAVKNFKVHDKIKMSLFFGAFQCLMPILGFMLGRTIVGFIAFVDHWIAFILLSGIGGNMILEAIKGDDQNLKETSISNKTLFFQAIATSIDALIVGLTFAVLEVDIYSSSIIIGVVCFGLSFAGAIAGEKLGSLFKEKAEILGGVILIIIGLNTLLEHLFF